jgi:hypothetical protein
LVLAAADPQLPAAWAIARRHAPTDPEVTLAGVEWGWDEARERFVADWSAVREIAAALVRWRTVRGEDVATIYRGAARHGTAMA